MADHNIRIILEAVDKGSTNLRKFFSNSEKEVESFRRSLRGAKKEADEIFLSGGGKGTRGPGGRFEKEVNNINKATLALRKFKKELKESFSSGFVGGFASGAGEEREIAKRFETQKKLEKRALTDAKNAEKDALEDRLKEIRAFHAKALRDFETTQEIEIKARHNALIKEKADEANFLEAIITAERQASVKRGEVETVDPGLRARINELRKEQDQIQANRKAEIDAHKERLRIDETVEKSTARRESREKQLAFTSPNDVDTMNRIRTEVRALGSDIDKNESRLRKFGTTSGRAFGEFRNGLRIARNGLSDTEKEFLKESSAAQKFGARIGNAFSLISPFRARTLALISVLQIFGTLLVQLGSALVALASSAVLAGAALGGALLAGATQLIPVVGLLAAAFARLGKVLEAAQLADKLNLKSADDQKTKLDTIRAAVQRLADSRYSLKKAGEAVKDAEYDLAQAHIAVNDALKDQVQAHKDLAEARKQASRDIVDANFAEKDAALALKDAELAVFDAKKKLRDEVEKDKVSSQNIDDAKAQIKEAQQRLAQARAEGDQNEVATALQQLSVAEQDLQQLQANVGTTKHDVEQARNDVEKSKLQHKEAIVNNNRAQQDAAQARKKGVEGSDRVVSAQKQLVQATRQVAQANRQVALAERGIRDSVHALAVAKREETDAERGLTDAKNKATSQQQQLQNALGDLSPAEKKLFKSIQRIKEIYKRNFRPITDIIISSFSRALDTVSVLLKDPQILNGAKKLAEAIANSVDKLAHFAVSPEFKKFITFTLAEASKNVPKITDGFIALGRVLIRIARAATPIFDELLTRFVKFLERLDKGTKNSDGINKFFATAGKHLDSWINFAEALGRILGLIIKFSAASGKGILDDLTGGLDHIADWLSSHGKEVREFFSNIRIQVRALGITLGTVAKILFNAFKGDSATQLSQFILKTVIPAFALFLDILGLLAKGLNSVFKIPLVGPFAQNILKAFFALVLLTKLIKTFLPLMKALNSAFIALKETTILVRIQLLALAAAEKIIVVFNAIRGAIIGIGIASRAALATPPLGLIAIIALIIGAIILLDRKFHFLMPTLKLLLKAFQFVFNWIKDHWKLLLVILLGPFGLVLLGIIKWRDKIFDIIKEIVNFVRDHWKLIIAILLAPFALAGAIIFAIIKWREKIFDIIRAIPNAIVGFFKSLPDNLKKIFDKIPGLLKDALKGLGGIVTDAIKKIPGGKRLLGALGFGGKSDEQKFADFIKDPLLDAQDRKKAKRLHDQGLDTSQVIGRLAKDQGISVEDAKKLFAKYVFKDGGQVPGVSGAVPIIAHAGEWVVNKMQQSKLAKNLGMTTEQLKMNLFGTGGASTAGTKPTSKAKPYSIPGKFNLVPKEDPDGIVVWFIEMADGAFGQVSARDARRIIDSGGEFIPGYVRRSSHGFNARFKSASGGYERARGKVRHQLTNTVRDRGWQKFAMGGVVSSWAGPGLQSFAEGGTVLSQPSFGAPASDSGGTKSIEQNFNVTTQNDTDWNYILRIGALHANSSYT